MTVILTPPNTIDQIETIWAVVSHDETGEGLCGALIDGRWTSLTVADERLVSSALIPLARQVARMTGKSLRLVKFTTREDIKEIPP